MFYFKFSQRRLMRLVYTGKLKYRDEEEALELTKITSAGGDSRIHLASCTSTSLRKIILEKPSNRQKACNIFVLSRVCSVLC